MGSSLIRGIALPWALKVVVKAWSGAGLSALPDSTNQWGQTGLIAT
jgi:hypothetical protein